MPLTTIARFRNPVAAHIARARLEAEGIPVFLADEHGVGVLSLYSDPEGGVKLNVPEPFVEAAREVVSRDHSRDLRAAARGRRRRVLRAGCPSCGSTRGHLRTEAHAASGFVCLTNRSRCARCNTEW